MNIKQLMMVLRIEVSKRYAPDAYRQVLAMPRVPHFRDTMLDGEDRSIE
jgi:hypothetical protein